VRATCGIWLARPSRCCPDAVLRIGRDVRRQANGWKITSVTKRPGGGPPLKEYFLVTIEDRHEAVKALRERKNL
jgi:hypothetical protein